MSKNKLELFNAQSTEVVNRQNREIRALGNTWAQHLLDNNPSGGDFPLMWPLGAKAVRAYCYELADASDTLKLTSGFELQCGTLNHEDKSYINIKLQTPTENLQPFEEARPFVSIAITESLLSDVPTGPWMDDNDCFAFKEDFTQGWTDEQYDYPVEMSQLAYLIAFVRFPARFLPEKNLLHITKPQMVSIDLCQKILNIDPKKAALMGRNGHCIGMYFRVDDKKIIFMQITVFFDSIAANVGKAFDHVTYRAMLAEHNNLKK